MFNNLGITRKKDQMSIVGILQWMQCNITWIYISGFFTNYPSMLRTCMMILSCKMFRVYWLKVDLFLEKYSGGSYHVTRNRNFTRLKDTGCMVVTSNGTIGMRNCTDMKLTICEMRSSKSPSSLRLLYLCHQQLLDRIIYRIPRKHSM